MKKVIRLTESDLIRLVKKVIKEQVTNNPGAIRMRQGGQYSGASTKTNLYYTITVDWTPNGGEDQLGTASISVPGKVIVDKSDMFVGNGTNKVPVGSWSFKDPSLIQQYGYFKNIKKIF